MAGAVGSLTPLSLPAIPQYAAVAVSREGLPSLIICRGAIMMTSVVGSSTTLFADITAACCCDHVRDMTSADSVGKHLQQLRELFDRRAVSFRPSRQRQEAFHHDRD